MQSFRRNIYKQSSLLTPKAPPTTKEKTFFLTRGIGAPQELCSFQTITQIYKANLTTNIVVGDILYIDSNLTTPFSGVGQNYFYGFSNQLGSTILFGQTTYLEISNLGQVLSITTQDLGCDYTLNIQAFFTSSQNACLNTYPSIFVVVNKADLNANNEIIPGIQLWDDTDFTIPFNPTLNFQGLINEYNQNTGNVWVKAQIAGINSDTFTFSVDENGITTSSQINC